MTSLQAHADLNQLLMLLLSSGCLLAFLLSVSLLLFFLHLLELPSTVQSSSSFTVAAHLLYFAQLPDALLMSGMQQLI